MGMAPVTLALDPTDDVLEMPGVSDGTADFHDDPLIVDPASARRLPWSKPGYDLLLLSQYGGDTSAICPRAYCGACWIRRRTQGLSPRYGLELEYTLFDDSIDSVRAKGYRNLKTATPHKSHDLVLYQVQQTEWYEAVAAIASRSASSWRKCTRRSAAAFMEACIAAGEGLEPADQLVLLKTFIRALALRQDKLRHLHAALE